METSTRNYDVAVAGVGTVEVTVSERGEGSPFLLLHGGGGPLTVSAFADLVAAEPAHVITPTHPGFAGTPRPDALSSVRGLAQLYVALLETLQLKDVTVVGNSIGGWIAAEMALLESKRASRFILVDAVGIEVPGNPVVDFFSLTPRQVAEHSYHDPDRFGIDPTTLPPEALQAMAGNRATLTVYAGTSMNDPGLAGRLRAARLPQLFQAPGSSCSRKPGIFHRSRRLGSCSKRSGSLCMMERVPDRPESIPDSHADLLQSRVAIMATVGPDGRPQVSALWFLAQDGTVRISLNTSRQKTKNLKRNPKVSVILLDHANPHRYVELRGDAEIEPDNDYKFADLVGGKYGVDLRSRDRAGESRVIVTIHPLRVRTWG